jgi:hypothetical protein
MKKLFTFTVLLFSSMSLFSQIEVKYFNAGWNKANDIEWVNKLSDCELERFDIGTDPSLAAKYKVIVVPTIVIFQDGEEVERYQADISFKIAAIKEEVQDYIDELIMSAF